MVTEETACKLVKSARRYNRINQRNKKISISVDKEGKYNIITITEINIHLKTGNITISSALKYHGVAVYPQKFGKRNCKDPKFIEKLETKKKKDSEKHKDRHTEYNKKYYIKNKERMSIQRRQKRMDSYWRGKGPNPRDICPKCGEDMYNSYCRRKIGDKQKWIVTGLQCLCGYHENLEEGLEILRGKNET